VELPKSKRERFTRPGIHRSVTGGNEVEPLGNKEKIGLKTVLLNSVKGMGEEKEQEREG